MRTSTCRASFRAQRLRRRLRPARQPKRAAEPREPSCRGVTSLGSHRGRWRADARTIRSPGARQAKIGRNGPHRRETRSIERETRVADTRRTAGKASGVIIRVPRVAGFSRMRRPPAHLPYPESLAGVTAPPAERPGLFARVMALLLAEPRWLRGLDWRLVALGGLIAAIGSSRVWITAVFCDVGDQATPR